MDETTKAFNDAVRTAIDALPSVFGKVVMWLILLTVVLLGLPFAVGFWVGSLREKSRQRKNKE